MICTEDEWVRFGDYEFGGHEGTLFVRYTGFDSSFNRSNEWIKRFNILDYDTTPTSKYTNEFSCYGSRKDYVNVAHLRFYPVDWLGELIEAFEEFEKKGLYIEFNCKDLKALLDWLHFETTGWLEDGFGNICESATLDRFKIIKNYGSFRYQVLERDEFSCVACGSKNNLNVHHIYSFKNHVDLGDVVSNGITLCEDCHKKYHDEFGYKSNPIDLINFLGAFE